jgi:hypothetical protein
MKNPKNILIIYFHVLFNYLIYFVGLTCLLTIVVGLMSQWSINMGGDLIRNISKNPQAIFGQLSPLAISALFSAFEVKFIGLGWFCYGGLLLSRLYYFTRPQAEWQHFPDYVRFFWDYIVIFHPIIHHFFGGKFAERAAMTGKQREYMSELDLQARRQLEARQRSFDAHKNRYGQLSPYQRRELENSNISSGDDYARNKMGDP